MFFKLLMLFTIVPIVELYILVNVGKEIGTINTIGIVILTGVAGASFARSQGAMVIGQIRSAVNQGEMPGRELLQGAMVLVGAVLLITPGFVTDIVGLSLLFPVTRALYTAVALKYLKKKIQPHIINGDITNRD